MSRSVKYVQFVLLFMKNMEDPSLYVPADQTLCDMSKLYSVFRCGESFLVEDLFCF